MFMAAAHVLHEYVPNLTKTKLETKTRENIIKSLNIQGHYFSLGSGIARTTIAEFVYFIRHTVKSFSDSEDKALSFPVFARYVQEFAKKYFPNEVLTERKKYLIRLGAQIVSGILVDYGLDTETGKTLVARYQKVEKSAEEIVEKTLGNGTIISCIKSLGGDIKRHLPHIIAFFAASFLYDAMTSLGNK
jgi:hypothetical protein